MGTRSPRRFGTLDKTAWRVEIMKTIIHVNQHNIKKNNKLSMKRKVKVLTVKTYKSNTYCNEVEILGNSKVIYSPNKPLSCGAKVWIETNNNVEIVK